MTMYTHKHTHLYTHIEESRMLGEHVYVGFIFRFHQQYALPLIKEKCGVWNGRPKGFSWSSSRLCFVIDNLYSFDIWFLPFQAKSAESKKAKKDKPADGDSDEEEVLDDLIEGDSEIESDEYDVPYDGEEDDIECDGKLFTLFPIILSKTKTTLSCFFFPNRWWWWQWWRFRFGRSSVIIM